MTSRIWTGTASVVSGYTTVVLSGDPLTDANCPADATIVLDGATYFVAERVDTTTVELTRIYEGSDGPAASAEIDPMTAATISLVTISTRVAALNSQLSLLDANGRGLFYKSLGVTGANDPGPGYLGRDATDWPDVSALYFDVLDQNGQDVSDQINLFTSGDIFIIRSIATNAVARFQVASVSDQTGWFIVLGEYLGGSDIIADGEEIAVEWRRVGVGVEFDTQVSTPGDLTALEGQARGYRVLVSNYDGAGRSAVVTLLESGSPTSWSDAAYMTGPVGPAGAGEDGLPGSDGIDALTEALTEYITTAGSHVVSATVRGIVLNLAAPGTVDLVFGAVAARDSAPLKISDWAGNVTLTGTPNGSEKLQGIAGSAIPIGVSSGQGLGLALSLTLFPNSSLSGWFA